MVSPIFSHSLLKRFKHYALFYIITTVNKDINSKASFQRRVLLEKEEQAAADELHLQPLVDVAAEKLQQLGDVWERKHQQGNFQLTGGSEPQRRLTGSNRTGPDQPRRVLLTWISPP